MRKRILSLLLAVCMTVTLLAVPAAAASTDTVTFADIHDQNTAMAVESLRLMGVLDGYGDGSFRPDATLTRAQFCKMAVYVMDGADELGRYSTVTIFPDVKPSHWAASYINMAAKGKGIIAGYADGKFHPDQTVTVGQAVTILLRLLGYKDENIGGIWPQSYVSQAATIGLTDGVSTDGYAALTRGQAARLFLNLLRADMAEGGSYAATLGTTVTDAMLSSSTADAPGSVGTALQLANGTTYSIASGKASNGMLNGHKGTLIVNKQGEALTFVPDGVGSSKTITLSSATATQIVDITGAKYVVSGDTQAFYNGKETTWAEAYSWLNAGNSVTLYLNAAGVVEYVFVGGGTTSNSAVVVYEDRSVAGFSALTGGNSNYTIYKNGVKAGVGDMRKYDVATYSSATNSIRVCDTRISGYYESCYPNTSEPSKITVLGHEFNVLPSAMESLSKFKPGSQITLLLTEDNQVAGAVEASGGSGASGNAVGIAREVSSSSVTVDLLCGITISGSASISQSSANQMAGQLVRVSSTKKGVLNVSRVSGGVSGDLDVEAEKLGGKDLAENVIIFQQGTDGLESISLRDIPTATVPSNEITCAVTDWAGRVKILVLGSATGSTVIYGRTVVSHETTTDENGKEHTSTMLAVEYGDGKSVGPFKTGYSVSNGEYVAVTLNRDRDGYSSLIRLSQFNDVPNSAWTGESAVTIGGRTYTVPSNVACYNRTTRSWMSLSAAHAYADVCDMYMKDGVIRVIEVH